MKNHKITVRILIMYMFCRILNLQKSQDRFGNNSTTPQLNDAVGADWPGR